MIEPGNERISITRQCELLGTSRSGYYYKARPDSEDDLRQMRLIDERFTLHPTLGSRSLSQWLQRQGECAGRDRVRRLMRKLGIEAIYPKKCLTAENPAHKKYPYLLRGMDINCPDLVWCSDITYIRLRGGFVYLTAVMDWHSRFVLSWELSITMEADFCVSALEQALEINTPQIFNTDQGSQYTSGDFTKCLIDREIQISMDGRGRAFDNIMIERLWRSVKYEEIYLKEYPSVSDCRRALGEYFEYYNYDRLHQTHGYRTPWEVYQSGLCS